MEAAVHAAVAESALSKIASFRKELATKHTGVALPFNPDDLPLIETFLTKVIELLSCVSQNEDPPFINRLEGDIGNVYEIDDLLDEISIYILQMRADGSTWFGRLKSIFAYGLPQHLRSRLELKNSIAWDFLKRENSRLESISLPILRLFSNSVMPEDVVGRDEDKDEIIKMLSSASGFSVLPILGMAGMGKTTLARFIYDDHWCTSNFEFRRWVSLTEDSKIENIFEAIKRPFNKDPASGQSSFDDLKRQVDGSIGGNKYFFVLDDVWIEDREMWKLLLELLARGRGVVLVTTRIRNVASVCGTLAAYELQRLTDDACWSLFSQSVFSKNESDLDPNLVEIGKMIVMKCFGNPFLAKYVGRLLCRTRDEEEWRRIGGDIYRELGRHGSLSKFKVNYKVLPSHLKARFAYCCIMQLKDGGVLSSHLATNWWRAQGLVETSASKEMGEMGDFEYMCFTELVGKSCIQDAAFLFNNHACCGNVHEILRELARQEMGGQLTVISHLDDVSLKSLHIRPTTMYIVWCGVTDDLVAKQVLKKLSYVERVRTFIFGKQIGCINRSFLQQIVSRCKRLRVLDVSDNDVEKLPDSIGELKHLRLLNLSGNHAIRRLPSTICKLFNLQTLNLDGCEQLEELPEKIHYLFNLSYFSITSKQSTLATVQLNQLSSLQHLELFSCRGLMSLWADGKCPTSLRKLFIFDCQRLTSFPISMDGLFHVKELAVHNCPELDLEHGMSLAGLKSLQSLEIIGIPKLVNLPSELSSATALQFLMISDCQNLITLTKSLPNLKMLQKLCIYDCPNLLMQPEELQSLAALQLLDIRLCPSFSRSFRSKTDISHIPEIIINGWRQQVQGRKSTGVSSSKINSTHRLPRSLSYFSLKQKLAQVKDSKGLRIGVGSEMMMRSRWKTLFLAVKAIIRMRTMVKETKYAPQKLLLQKRWKTLLVVVRAIIRMRTMVKETKYAPQKLTLQKRWKTLFVVVRAIIRMRTMVKETKYKLILQKRWKTLFVVVRAIIRMKIMTRERDRKTVSELSHDQVEMLLHCYLFDNNHEFDRDKLIQLWIAANCLKVEPLEENGQQFFDSLLSEKFNILTEGVLWMGTRMYKVNLEKLNVTLPLNPIINEFEMKFEGRNMTVNESADSLRISMLTGTEDEESFEILKKLSGLRTLLILNCPLIKQLPSDLFLAVKSLTALDLSGSCITELPSSIGDVKELSYLDLSSTLIERLPKSIVRLQKLQTLRLKECIHLFDLPEGMEQLLNLRHLDFDVLGQLSFMPRGIGVLTQLRTLSAFIVDGEEDCNIKELKHMNNLSGKLCISGLELVINADDAMEVCLADKTRLRQLELRWSDIVQVHEGSDKVLEYLSPNSCLEELQIVCFPGSKLPGWIDNSNLVSITLFKCENCKELPSLGRLPRLKTIDIIEMNGVEKIGDQFCREPNDHNDTPFPVLKELAIDGMLSLTVWEGFITGECPCLEKLSIKRCPKMENFYACPSLRYLKHLEIIDCPLLECLPEDLLSSPLKSIAIDACPSLKKIRGEELRKRISDVWIGSDDAVDTEDGISIEETFNGTSKMVQNSQ